MTYTQRYQQAHEANFKRTTPNAYADGHYFNPVMPKIKTANGLTNFICNFVLWSGYRATRINTTGRLVDGTEKGPTGNVIGVKKWIPGTTRRGTADISMTIKGRSVMIEIKVGNDKPSAFQLTEQARERAAGGIYEFIHNPDEFISLYDKVVTL